METRKANCCWNCEACDISYFPDAGIEYGFTRLECVDNYASKFPDDVCDRHTTRLDLNAVTYLGG